MARHPELNDVNGEINYTDEEDDEEDFDHDEKYE